MIALRAKHVDFETTYINLLDKPDWFLRISPHGKVPVLLIDGEPLYESNAIAEYLDETVPPRLHPEDAFRRARNRAWTDYVPTFASGLSGIYYTKTPEAMAEGLKAAPTVVQRLEDAIARERGNDGPYFNGDRISLVDAAYAPFLQRFGFVERKLRTGLLDGFPLVRAWSDARLATELVTGSVPGNFEEEFVKSLKRRGFHVGTLF